MVVSQVKALNSKALKNLQNVNFYILIWHRIVLSWFMSLSSTDFSLVACFYFSLRLKNIIHVMYINFSFFFLVSPSLWLTYTLVSHSLVFFFHRANGKLIHPEVDGVGVSDVGRRTQNWRITFRLYLTLKKKRKQITWNI